jgi:electron transport complex protein RnfG
MTIGEIIKMVVVLMLIAGILAGVLGMIYVVTEPHIKEAERLEAEAARKEALPDAALFVEKTAGDYVYYEGLAQDSSLVGYCVTAAGVGYSSTIKTIVGVNKSYEIQAISIVSIVETPGLGMNALEDKFKDQFKGLKVDKLWVKGKDTKPGASIDCITGSTITTKAITYSVRDAIDQLKSTLGGT